VLAETGPLAAGQASALLGAFARAWPAALRALGIPARDLPPTRVLLLRPGSFDELTPYERRGTLGGYARSSGQEATVVVRADASPLTLRHEVAHVVLNTHLETQPLWVSEGLCDLLGAMEGAGDALGAPLGLHLEVLRRGPRPPVADVIDAGQSAAVYAPGDAQRMFDATAWLLAHRLLIGLPDGPARLRAYLAEVAAGADRQHAFTRAFGMSPAEADRALDEWLGRGELPVLRLATAAEPPPPAPVATAAEAGEADLALGRLLLHLDRTGEAARRLERAVQRAPLRAEAHEALAEARLRQRRLDLARRHVDIARALDPSRGGGLVRLAQLRLQEAWSTEAGETEAVEREVLGLLAGALRLDPGNPDAIEMRARLDPHPVAVRIAELTEVLRRDPERDELGMTLASLHIRRYSLGRAATVLRQVRERTRDDALRFIAGHMLTRIAEATAGTVEEAGRLIGIECPKKGFLVFRFAPARGGAELPLSASATSLLLFDAQGEAGERSFTCGPQDHPVEVWYRPLTDGALLMALTLLDR
jgi:tetratricopeptide (TPR) repeat protein